MLSVLSVSPDYFRTMRASLLSGREFKMPMEFQEFPVVIVNQRFASSIGRERTRWANVFGSSEPRLKHG